MLKNYLSIKTISCSLPAKQWGLYTTLPNCDAVADKLNRTVEELFAKGGNSRDIRSSMLQLMWSYKVYGAYDTEPMGVLGDVLETLFGDEE